jgi:hypothetical protein
MGDSDRDISTHATRMPPLIQSQQTPTAAAVAAPLAPHEASSRAQCGDWHAKNKSTAVAVPEAIYNVLTLAKPINYRAAIAANKYNKNGFQGDSRQVVVGYHLETR